MPTYEHECRACGRRFDSFQPMSGPMVVRCPECGGEARRLISAGAGVVVKKSDASRSLRSRGRTCCGRDERCDKPPCGDGGR